MRNILEELKNGNVDIARKYSQCDELWSEILSGADDISVDDLAQRLSDKQLTFEWTVGDRYLGKTIMAYSGFTHLYSCDHGFDDNIRIAKKLADAFAKSYCSLEVKSDARYSAELYNVYDYE